MVPLKAGGFFTPFVILCFFFFVLRKVRMEEKGGGERQSAYSVKWFLSLKW